MKIKITDLSKSYSGLPVLNKVTMTLQSGTVYCLMGASGSGKTTFFRILLGLEQADSGTIQKTDGSYITAVFQENRLCESFSPLENIMMVLPGNTNLNRSFLSDELCRLLPKDSITRPTSTLSGGQKRRVAIFRALLPPFDAVFLDEPFAGLDEETKLRVMDYIKEKSMGKLVVISTHQEEDVKLLGGSLICLT